MKLKPPPSGGMWITLLLGLGSLVLAASIVYAPGAAFEASMQGLTVWWRIVFPGLLPFLVISHILTAYGFVHALGALLGPLLQKGFGLPAAAAWTIPLGLTAGFPAGAEAAAQLYKEGSLSRQQAEKLSAISHFCSPMLLIVVIGTGFLHRPRLALLLAVIHVLSGAAAAWTLQYIFSRRTRQQDPTADSNPLQVLPAIEAARRSDGRTFGRLLGDSVSSSVQTLMMIGGYMLIFAVTIRMLQLYLPAALPAFVLPSLLEVHLGAYSAASAAAYFPSPALHMAVLGALLGFSGISAMLQVRAILIPAGLGMKPFWITRMLHSMYAYVLTLLVWEPVMQLVSSAESASVESGQPSYPIRQTISAHSFLTFVPWQLLAFFVCLGCLILWAALRRITHLDRADRS